MIRLIAELLALLPFLMGQDYGNSPQLNQFAQPSFCDNSAADQCLDFEETSSVAGNCSAEGGAILAGTPDCDYTGVVLAGTQSLRVNSSTTTTNQQVKWDNWVQPTPGTGTLRIRYQFRGIATGTGRATVSTSFNFDDPIDGHNLLRVRLSDTDNDALWDIVFVGADLFAANSTVVDAFSEDTDYCFQVDYHLNNDDFEMWVDATTAEDNSDCGVTSILSNTSGTETGLSASDLFLQNTADNHSDWIIDNIEVFYD